MADYTRPLFRHKFSKKQAMADYERLSSPPGRRRESETTQVFDIRASFAGHASRLANSVAVKGTGPMVRKWQ